MHTFRRAGSRSTRKIEGQRSDSAAQIRMQNRIEQTDMGGRRASKARGGSLQRVECKSPCMDRAYQTFLLCCVTAQRDCTRWVPWKPREKAITIAGLIGGINRLKSKQGTGNGRGSLLGANVDSGGRHQKQKQTAGESGNICTRSTSTPSRVKP